MMYLNFFFILKFMKNRKHCDICVNIPKSYYSIKNRKIRL